MTDDPFYAPGHVSPRRQPRPGEHVWEVRVDHVTWSCEFRFHGESYGWEAQILRNGELFAGQRFIWGLVTLEINEPCRAVLNEPRRSTDSR